jgi:hypothetical protein
VEEKVMLSYKGRNAYTVNFMKTVYFDKPEWTQAWVSVMPATWMKYRRDMEEIVAKHPKIFGKYEKGKKDFDRIDDPLYNPGKNMDTWSCTWENVEKGLSSYVTTHPLENWDNQKKWKPPNPEKDAYLGPWDWAAEKKNLEKGKKNGGLASAGPVPHGFMYMRLFYLRGFENLMMDLASEDPRMEYLIKIVRDYNAAVVKKFIDMGAEWLSFGDDLGLQKSLPMSPDMWRKYIKPAYEAIIGQCRDRDVIAYLHTDGHILEIIPDLKDAGVKMVNPQIGANGIEGLKKVAKGKIAMNVDLNRQFFPFGTPSQLNDHVHEVYEALYSPKGGFMMSVEFEPDVPLVNMEAVLNAVEDVCNLPEPQT